MSGSARIFNCARCHAQVIICSDCDHGQIYCSHECSQMARTISCCLAGKRYQNSYRGRINHAARQHRYRERQRNKKEKVTHHSSNENDDYASLSVEPDKVKTGAMCCHFCKKPVDPFLRRGFLSYSVGNASSRTGNWARAP